MADDIDDLPTLSESGARGADAGELLLPGEDPDSPYGDDIEHWIEVYTELLRFKVEMLSSASEHMAAMLADARDDVKFDWVILTNQRDRYRRRLQFWTDRRETGPAV